MSLGPVFQLQWWGVLCPCLEKDEDRAARQSLVSLQNRRVRWHPSGNNNSINIDIGGVTSLVVGLFKKSTSSVSNSSSSKNAIMAKMLVVDDATNGPTLQISPVTNNKPDDQHEWGDEQSVEQQPPETSASAASFMKCIPLRQVKQVQPEGKEGSTLILLDSKNQTLLRLDICKKNSVDHSQLVSTVERTEVMDALSILFNWVQRCPKTSSEEEAEDDTPVRNRAQQVAHFAKREIELQQKKREREKRKAGYLEKSKGLKYTALAMANREESR